MHKSFEPEKFIDREFEQELFEELLRLQDDARILSIADGGGMGKSQLLERFRYRCRTVRPRTAVCLLSLDQPGSSPLSLARRIREQLQNALPTVPFPAFDRAEAERMLDPREPLRKLLAFEPAEREAAPRDEYSHYERGLAELLKRLAPADQSDAGVYQQRLSEVIKSLRLHGDTREFQARLSEVVTQLNNLALSKLGSSFTELCGPPAPAALRREPAIPGAIPADPAIEQAVQDASVRALFEDLRAYATQQSVVLLFDAFEKCPPPLRTWIIEYLLERHFFDREQRPARLLLVLAGREALPFKSHWSVEDCGTIVRSVTELGKWSRVHIEECLKAHGFDYGKRELKLFCDMSEMGLPPSQIVDTMQSLHERRRRRA